ncbi:hypothetical protein BV25DRAFT_1840112 [Artomyces pyxidatus]|uniref:Uncharacterized protein n=1 Tax=Artomyces pyxidatus TaxID=48021 RepID=A0ACB8SV21_9AGAM|nr:hypothetical protein BV25DRAFT_1840112 [Artomyces pyxidatus]
MHACSRRASTNAEMRFKGRQYRPQQARGERADAKTKTKDSANERGKESHRLTWSRWKALHLKQTVAVASNYAEHEQSRLAGRQVNSLKASGAAHLLARKSVQREQERNIPASPCGCSMEKYHLPTELGKWKAMARRHREQRHVVEGEHRPIKQGKVTSVYARESLRKVLNVVLLEVIIVSGKRNGLAVIGSQLVGGGDDADDDESDDAVAAEACGDATT